MTWYCYRCPPQKELTGSDFLIERGVDAFSPCEFASRRQRRGNQRHVVTKRRTILYGYILINVPEFMTPWDFVRRFGGILKTVVGGDRPKMISDSDMDHLKSISGKMVTHYATPLRIYVEGDTVRITSGPLKGLKAVVARSKGEKVRVTLDAPLLGKQAVEVKQDSIEIAA